jgi:GGDEF domain-containing protein
MVKALMRARQPRPKKLPPIYDPASTWYQSWYFDLRLEEELARSMRYQLPFTVVALRLVTPISGLSERTGLNKRLAEIGETALRQTDIPALLGNNELAVLLPQTRPLESRIVVERLTRALGPYSPVVGLASYPEDSAESGVLLLTAQQRAVTALERSGLLATDESKRHERAG